MVAKHIGVITKKQEAAIDRLLPFMAYKVVSYEAVRAFFDCTDLGYSTYKAVLSLVGTQLVEFKSLMEAHAISSRPFSELLEGLWLNGMEDYSIAQIILSEPDGPVRDRAIRLGQKVYKPGYVENLLAYVRL